MMLFDEDEETAFNYLFFYFIFISDSVRYLPNAIMFLMAKDERTNWMNETINNEKKNAL
jgi:hypothetical protein